ncbi:PilZ domain-containing protein [Bradyrhizobium sp. G127]|jgi:hypothetical protein|uniref:PilZ domain-containing protein n=1 Tax=Bradyrhizobium sp. G127 TaxID=2904800 RepID=UPI001F2FBDD5|nr:PilZ domain-containing protein [Bradyrhizobium sp. G127]MCF2524339.1 PilZ domain-containing protein [Bradyrhizobium sp. G127]
MIKDKRSAARVNFERGVQVRILAIDGAWHRECEMLDVSESGALLRVADSIAGLELKEFFLVLSSVGTAHRRCALAWIDGDRLGANFIRNDAKPKKSSFVKR